MGKRKWSKKVIYFKFINRYEGSYLDGLFHGFGKGYYDNTENQPHPIYLGNWYQGSAEKQGLYFHPNGKIAYR